MGMFRQKALVKLKSPEQVDEPLKIMRRKSVWAVAMVLVVSTLALVWGFFGEYPSTGRGQGILITPNSVARIQCPADGQISRWYVSVGSIVDKGDPICTLSQPALERELAQAQAKEKEIEAKNQELKKYRTQLGERSRKTTKEKRTVLETRVTNAKEHLEQIKDFAKKTQATNKDILSVQKSNLLESHQLQVEVTKELTQRKVTYEKLRKEGLTSDETARNIAIRADDSALRVSDIAIQIKELDLKAVQAAQSELESRELIAGEENNLTQFSLQLRELDNREAQQKKQDSEADFREKNEVADVKQRIERLQERLRTSREVRASGSGRILELVVPEGAVVANGQSLAQIDTRAEGEELIALVYFQDAVGKRVQVGTPVRVSPSSVSQNRYGSIQGVVTAVTPYPVTAEAASNYVGNSETAQRLTRGGYQIEVRVQLQKDPSTPSGYAWTSHPGPDVQMTAGTTTDVSVTYERRAPLSFVLPIVRKWSGL